MARRQCTNNYPQWVVEPLMPPEEFDDEEHLDSALHWNEVADLWAVVNAFRIKAHHTISFPTGNGREIDKLGIALVKWEE